MTTDSCELCRKSGGEVIRDDGFARVVVAGDADHPGFCRVILNAHVREMTDLPEEQRAQLMRMVYAVEQCLRDLLAPDKINLASFGNVVAHLHWHVIPRFADDPHFPNSVWSHRQGRGARPLPAGFVKLLRQHLGQRLDP